VDFALSPEDETFRDELRAWLDEHLPPFLEKEAADEAAEDPSRRGEATQRRRAAWQRELNAGGWAAIHWPTEYGGRAATAMQRVISSEVMAEYRTPGIYNTNGLWQIGPMIITWGTDEQKARWLPSILEAHEHWCQGFSEPDAGNDLANLRTTAILDGDHYVVNGQKIWISSAHLAKWGLFLMRTDPTAIERGAKHEGITAFIIDMETPGIEVRPIRDMTGEELFNEIYFNDARIPVDCRLGDEGAGWMVAMGTLGFERVGIAGQISVLGADLRAMIEAARSVNPGALEDPGITDRLAKAWTEIELARLLSLRALSRIIKGERPWPEVQFAKIEWAYLAQTLAELAIDLLGPAGVLARGGPDTVDRGKWTRLYSFQRYSTIGGGSTEVQKNIIADRAIKLPGQARLS
jgi:alkylation response protein AidB-like acyl-CoA dehydrogenase